MNGTKVDSLWRFRDPEPGRWLQLFCSQHIFEDRNVWYSCFHVCVFKGKMGGGGSSGSFWRKEHFRSNTRKNLLKLRAISLMIWEFLSLPKSDHDFFFFSQQCSKGETIILQNKFRSIFWVVCLASMLSEIHSVSVAGQQHDWPFPQFESAPNIMLIRNRVLF